MSEGAQDRTGLAAEAFSYGYPLVGPELGEAPEITPEPGLWQDAFT
jgi:hypothetical protein